MIFITAWLTKAVQSRYKFQGAQPSIFSTSCQTYSGAWTKEMLTEPNGTTRVISREVRGNNVQNNSYAPGQSRNTFHQGIYKNNGNRITIFLDGGTFSHSKQKTA